MPRYAHNHLKGQAVARRCSVKKGALRNFAKFTGKHLCQRLFFNKVAGLRQITPNYTETVPFHKISTLGIGLQLY